MQPSRNPTAQSPKPPRSQKASPVWTTHHITIHSSLVASSFVATAGEMPPRRRDRRRPRDPSPPSSDARAPPSASGLRLTLLVPLLLLALVLAALGFSGLLSRSPPHSQTLQTTAHSVYERGLVKRDVSAREILAEHTRVSENRSQRNFPNPVLAYVTPWNSKGYDMAKLFSKKLTHVSPVWYDLKSDRNRLVLEGEHNFDAKWVSELQSNGSLVVPRIVLEAFPAVFLLEKKQKEKAIDLIVSECRDKGYDGIVLESWSRWAIYGVLDDQELRYMALQFLKQLGEALHSVSSQSSSRHLELIYVIPAPRMQKLNNQDFGPEDLVHLADTLDGFSLMTYDFSGPQNPGPSAPLKWVHDSLAALLSAKGSSHSSSHSQMIFLGINFYGNDFLLSRVVVVLSLEEILFIYLRSTSHLCSGMRKVWSIFSSIRMKA
ncbi:chitinase domain-containing protein 1 isoform X2 [Sorghum bicolor]|uniref:chitinase domain-containing protein 1 isoform X2 n=1 Tax=Sorghum bicolor TaxID=4558 RepID=UPI000B425B41|nr:chitinase domain-containing protein 1 isoform X2 [Sorghum bicolor]|eukprot:XP_021313412.1 chitinase domain-containing protein 1 isoform X2 [Sorghum bicolor]